MKKVILYQSPLYSVFYFPGPQNPKVWEPASLHPPVFSTLTCPLWAELLWQSASLAMRLGWQTVPVSLQVGTCSLTVTAEVAAWGACGGFHTLSSFYSPSVAAPTTHLWVFQVSKGRAGSSTCAHRSSPPENNYPLAAFQTVHCGGGGWVGSMQGTLNSYNTAGSLGYRQIFIKDMVGRGWVWLCWNLLSIGILA